LLCGEEARLSTRSTAIATVIAARQRLPLTEAKFRAELERVGVVDRLRTLDLWRDNIAGMPLVFLRKKRRKISGMATEGFTFDDLWWFYRTHARSDFDVRAASLLKSSELRELAKGLRNAARVIRRSLKLLGIMPLLSSGAETLRLAADTIDIPKATRDGLIAAGVPDDRIMGYADQVQGLADAIRDARKRGRLPDLVANTFRAEWAVFAIDRAGSALDEIGELLFPIVVGCDAPNDYARSRRRRFVRR
jgi:hypothetical protein